MSTYNGYFQVTNNTGGAITNVTASHVASGQTTTYLPPCNLANGTSSQSIALSAETSSKDRWSLSFIQADGQVVTGNENCGFESEDNGLTVVINLSPEDFDINMPASRSCVDNDYNG
ncbi:MAG: hypothetical protein ABI411_16255 [Tahibacter sp.]